jgi:lipopolysaccharide/colanic/teichoic acid biosynthesis glycosyltransferase
MKRAFSIAAALAGLTLAGVPMALAALAIKLTSPGPIFYRQQRVGQGGRLFWLYKFRTMRVHDGNGPQVTPDGDARITHVGGLLRRWKIDELPQFWNILRGDMSVIGPRPEVAQFVRLYTPEQRCVLDDKPGLAGPAQLVLAHEADLLRGHPNPEEAYIQYVLPRKLEVDLQYARQRTFWSDLRLMGEIVLLLLGKNTRQDANWRITLQRASD